MPTSTPTETVADVAAAAEIPELTGKTLAEARTLLDAIGIPVEVDEDPSLEADAVGDARMVERQHPEPGTVVRAGYVVRLTVAGDSGPERTKALRGTVVVIDPGHQARADSATEPIGPGATTTKARVTSGTSGVATRVPEYEVVLQIAMNLKARLEDAGVTVVMTRTTNDVDMSNAERAKLANAAGADLFVRVHADGHPDSSKSGISTLHPAENPWTEGIVAPSRRAARLVHDSVVASTGAVSLGLVERDDLTGFNWSSVPVVLVECGFMTNPVEDRLLSSPHYQDRLAEGISAGIIAFLGE